MNESWPIRNNFTVTVFCRGVVRQRWRWHVTAVSGEIVASGEAYARRIDAISLCERLFPRVES